MRRTEHAVVIVVVLVVVALGVGLGQAVSLALDAADGPAEELLRFR